jgi:hypothetical protein
VREPIRVSVVLPLALFRLWRCAFSPSSLSVLRLPLQSSVRFRGRVQDLNASAAVANANAAAANANAAAAYANYTMGEIVPRIPAGCATPVVNGITYYLCGNTWFSASYGANGAYYRVVTTP